MVVLGIDPGKGEECKVAVVDACGKFAGRGGGQPLAAQERRRGDAHDAARTASQSTPCRRSRSGPEPPPAKSKPSCGTSLARRNSIKCSDRGGQRRGDRDLFVVEGGPRGIPGTIDRDPLRRSAWRGASRTRSGELVKIDPKLIGVGQYQHDVDQKELHRGLLQTVQFCVNSVGVDLNTAGSSLLRYVSGLNDKLARRIVGQRANGPFATREALRSVPGVDDTVYQQAAGFVRVREGENPLDRTAVHPESYPTVEKMAASLNVPVGDLIGNKELVLGLKLEDFVADGIGLPTLSDIREELLRPGRDPRRTFTLPEIPGRRSADRRPQGGDDAGRDSHERDQLRRVRRRRACTRTAWST